MGVGFVCRSLQEAAHDVSVPEFAVAAPVVRAERALGVEAGTLIERDRGKVVRPHLQGDFVRPVGSAPLEEPVEHGRADATASVISGNHHAELGDPGRNKTDGRGGDDARAGELAHEHRSVRRGHKLFQTGGCIGFVHGWFRGDPSLLLGDGGVEPDGGGDVFEAGRADGDIGGVRGAGGAR